MESGDAIFPVVATIDRIWSGIGIEKRKMINATRVPIVAGFKIAFFADIYFGFLCIIARPTVQATMLSTSENIFA